ncbi:response regulator [Chloroflexota bacterium]
MAKYGGWIGKVPKVYQTTEEISLEDTITKYIERSVPGHEGGHSASGPKFDECLQMSLAVARVTILIVDDEAVIRELFKETLEDFGITVVTAESGAEGLELVKQQEFSLVFLDLRIPDISGVELFRQIRNLKPGLPVTIISAYIDDDMMAKALNQGPFGIMNKPFGESDIIKGVTSVLKDSLAKK